MLAERAGGIKKKGCEEVLYGKSWGVLLHVRVSRAVRETFPQGWGGVYN